MVALADDALIAVPAAPRRLLGFWMCLALVMGNMIGSGVFLLPASLAPYGWNAVIGWVLTIAGVLCLARVIALLARQLPTAGGPHGFTEAAFGETPAFLVSWSYWVGIVVGNAAIASAAVGYLSLFAPAMAATQGATTLSTVGLIWLFTLINLAGARSAGVVQLTTTILKVIPLIAVIVIIAVVFGGGHGAIAPLHRGDLSAGAVTGSASLAMFAMMGFECAAVAGARVHDAPRTVPRATMIGALATGLIYLVTCSGIALMLPANEVAASNAPFALFVARYWSAGWALVIAGFAAISTLGALNGWILAQGEVPLAMARGGGLPRWFGVTRANGAPARALMVSSVLSTILVCSNASRGAAGLFAFLALVSTASNLFLYLACAVSAFRLRAVGIVRFGMGMAVVTAIGVLFTLWTLFGAGTASLLGFGLMAGGLPVYWWTRSAAAAEPPEEAAVA
ncbi:amino acid permease [Sphingomonas koreensis]|nr:amino acid permease [Sphingomonas koreensis]